MSAIRFGELFVVVQKTLVFVCWDVVIFLPLINHKVEGMPALFTLVDQPYINLAAVGVDAELSRILKTGLLSAARTVADHCKGLCGDYSIFNCL